MKTKQAPIDMNAIRKLIQEKQFLAFNAKNAKWGFNLPLEDFAVAIAIHTPGAYGSRIANRLGLELGLSPSKNQNKGDKKKWTKNGELFFEIKGSLITSTNLTLNTVQIRWWQSVDYIVYCWDIRDTSRVELRYLYLTKDQMDQELRRCRIGSAHGTKEANKNNKTKELAIRLPLYSPDYFRWIKNYGMSLNDLKNKLTA